LHFGDRQFSRLEGCLGEVFCANRNSRARSRLLTSEAARIVEGSVRDAFDHWLADFPSHASKLLDFTVDCAEERLRRRADNEFVLHLNSFLHLKKASRFDSLFVFCILMLIFLLPRDASRLPERAQSQHRHVLVCRFQLRH
jgi:hypothetical protein